MKTNILVVGASRGLGLGLVEEYLRKGWHVIGTERKNDPESKLSKLAQKYEGKLLVQHVDIDDYAAIKALRKNLEGENLDILYVNAGIMGDKEQEIAKVSTDEFNHVMLTNALGPLRVLETLGDLVKPAGTMAVMSSGLGSVATNTSGGYDVYRASKAALNMLLKTLAARDEKKCTYLAISPGWVKTAMGGEQAPLSVETSAAGIAKTIEAHHEREGVHFVDYQNVKVPW
jgi:NAD(P)-dependent dehydrogenase (short-subunit alcohol dehydrogenase family)